MRKLSRDHEVDQGEQRVEGLTGGQRGGADVLVGPAAGAGRAAGGQALEDGAQVLGLHHRGGKLLVGQGGRVLMRVQVGELREDPVIGGGDRVRVEAPGRAADGTAGEVAMHAGAEALVLRALGRRARARGRRVGVWAGRLVRGLLRVQAGEGRADPGCAAACAREHGGGEAHEIVDRAQEGVRGGRCAVLGGPSSGGGDDCVDAACEGGGPVRLRIPGDRLRRAARSASGARAPQCWRRPDAAGWPRPGLARKRSAGSRALAGGCWGRAAGWLPGGRVWRGRSGGDTAAAARAPREVLETAGALGNHGGEGAGNGPTGVVRAEVRAEARCGGVVRCASRSSPSCSRGRGTRAARLRFGAGDRAGARRSGCRTAWRLAGGCRRRPPGGQGAGRGAGRRSGTRTAPAGGRPRPREARRRRRQRH